MDFQTGSKTDTNWPISFLEDASYDQKINSALQLLHPKSASHMCHHCKTRKGTVNSEKIALRKIKIRNV